MNPTRLLIGILLLSALLRFGGLSTESLWLDEGFTASQASSTFSQIFAEYHNETQTILFALIEKVWCLFFGLSEFALRFLPAVFGVISTLGIYLLARVLFSVRTGLYAALFLATNPFAIHYSQDARPYVLFLMAAIFSLYFLLRLMQTTRTKWITGYLVSTVICLYSHPLAPLLIPIHISALLIFPRDANSCEHSSNRWSIFGWIATACVLYLPQLFLMWQSIVAKAQGGSRAGWIPVPEWYACLQSIKHYFMNPAFTLAAGLILLVGTIQLFRRDHAFRSGFLWLTALCASFLLMPWGLSYVVTPVYVSRYTIPALVAFVILLGRIFSEYRSFRWRMILAVYLSLNAFTLYEYYAGQDKEPWRETGALLQQIVEQGDVIVVDAHFTKGMLSYYYHPPFCAPVFSAGTTEDMNPQIDFAAHIWLVQAYNSGTAHRTREFYRRLERNRTASTPIQVRGWTEPNPDSYWRADIRLIKYTFADSNYTQ